MALSLNTKKKTGVSAILEKPLTKLEFWTNSFVIYPENTI